MNKVKTTLTTGTDQTSSGEKSSRREDVAIIGMACVYPGAADLQTYWHNILAKKDSIIDVPPGRWDAELYFSEQADDLNKVYCKRGGYLDEFMTFDPAQYGVMPRGVEGGEPDQFLILQVVHEALKDAGYLDRPVNNHRTEFILGRGNYLGVGASNLIQRSIVTEQTLKILKDIQPDLTKEELAEIRRELLASLPRFSADSAPAFIPNLTTGRVANRLDFMGPNFTVDAACASSLIATDIGVQDLINRRCDLAITGGVHIFANVPFLLIFCAFQAMSLSSCIRPFDKDADGTLPGEGAGVVVLKRLTDAQRDGDRIYAIIKGIGVSSDGRAVSVVAPRLEGEELALRRAYEYAGISPRTIRLIEAHGVGTPVGDVIEVQAMRRVFGERDESGPRCALGTVKSMIGHAMPAAGVAGLIKAALALYHKILPPTINCQTVNPKLEIEKTPFYLNTETRPWIHGEKDFPRRAAVNAFGFGGINAHLILEEYVSSNQETEKIEKGTEGIRLSMPSTPRFWETEVFVFSGQSRQELIQQIESIQRFLGQNPRTQLLDLAYSLNTKLGFEPYRLATVASSVDDLIQKIAYARQRLADSECHQIKDLKGIYFFETPLIAPNPHRGKGKLAFLFPGEGAQYVNMLADLCMYFPQVRSCFDRGDQILLEQGQKDLPSYNIFPPPFFSEQERALAERRLWRMDRATEAVLTSNLAMHTLLSCLDIKPDQMVGHSAGEWSAMVFSGIIDPEEFLRNTGRLNQIYRKLSLDPTIPKATLIAVGTGLDQVKPILDQINERQKDKKGMKKQSSERSILYVADDNCPHQVIIAGEEGIAQEAMVCLRAKAIPFEKLPFDRGYHTPLFAPICSHLREYFSSFSISAPRTEIYSCTTMSPYPKEPQEILELAVKTWIMPVAFRQTIENMYNSGTRIFIEVGPRGNLTAFVEDILRGKPHLAIASNVMRRSGITQLNHLVGLLSAQGIHLNFQYLYQYRCPQTILWTDQQPKEKPKGKVEIKIPLGLYSLSVKKRKARKAHPQVPISTSKSLESEPSSSSSLPSSLSHSPTPPPLPSLPDTMATAAAADYAPSGTDYAPLGADYALSGADYAPSSGSVCLSSVVGADGFARPEFLNQTPPLAQAGPSSVMERYFQTMTDFLTLQKEMMETYLEHKSGRSYLPALGSGKIKSAKEWERIKSTTNKSINNRSENNSTESAKEQQSKNREAKSQMPDLKPEVLSRESQEQRPSSALAVCPEVPSRMSEEELTQIMLDLVSEKTGYPKDMIDLDLDMEGDLGIDSIKRVEIIGSFRTKYAQLREEDTEIISGLKTIRQVINFLKEKIGAGPNVGKLPFVGRTVDFKPGKSITVIRSIDLSEDLFIDDHRFGQKISALDASLGALPVVPMTVSIEIMAEVASLLFPGQKLIRVDQVAASQWICLENEKAATLLIKAELTAQQEAKALVYKLREGFCSANLSLQGQRDDEETSKTSGQGLALLDKGQKPLISARLFFADQYPAPPQVADFALQNERRPSHSAEQIYSQHRMFHGPRFQGIASLEAVGENGLSAQLRVLPTNNLFRSNPKPQFLTDPFLLDAAGQLVGYWPVEYLDSGFVIFPIALESLRLYGPPPAPFNHLPTRMRLREITSSRIRADLDLLSPGGGQILMQLIGWEDWRFWWSRELYDFWRFPHLGFIGQLMATTSDTGQWAPYKAIISAPQSQGGGKKQKVCAVYSLVQQFWRGDTDMFKQVMAYMVLSRKERHSYHQLPDAGEQGRWLIGRMAAKDAIRGFLRSFGYGDFYPADITLTDDAHGQPKPEQEWMRQIGVSASLCLAQTDNTAIAVVAEEGMSVGISLSPYPKVSGSSGQMKMGESSKELLESLDMFCNSKEKALLLQLDSKRQMEGFLRLRCAKEAVAKALGLSPPKGQSGQGSGQGRQSPPLPDPLWKEITIGEFDLSGGEVKVSLGEGEFGRKSPCLRKGDSIRVYRVYTVVQEREYIMAVAISKVGDKGSMEVSHNG